MKHFKINDIKIPYKFIDNKAKDTLVLVHGFDSTMNFFHNINGAKNFNVLSFSMPGARDVKYDGEISMMLFVEITSKILLKIKKGNIYLLGHSLGGAIISEQWDNKIVEKIFVCPLNPSITKRVSYKILHHIMMGNDENDKEVLSKTLRAIKATHKSSSNFIDKFLNKDSKWYDITINSIGDKEYIEKILWKNYASDKEKSIIIGATKDNVIKPKSLKKFANDLGIEYIQVEGNHNPFYTSNSRMWELLNERITYRKRSFFTRVLKRK